MGRNLRGMFLLTCLACLLLWGPASASSDITGYRLPGNTWLLGKPVDHKSLKGFKEVDSYVEGLTGYLDLSRTIQFDGQDADATVGLFLRNGKLASLVMEVDSDEKSFKTLKKYYRERYESADEIFSTTNSVMWQDDDEDYLALFKYNKPDGDVSTLIIYGRNSLMAHPEEEEVPDWMKNMLGQT